MVMPNFDQMVLRTPICLFLPLCIGEIFMHCNISCRFNKALILPLLFRFPVQHHTPCGHWLLPFLPVSGCSLSMSYSHYPQFLFDLISRQFIRVFLFSQSFHFGSHTFLCYFSLFLLSLLPRYLNLQDPTVSSTMSSVSDAGLTYCKV